MLREEELDKLSGDQRNAYDFLTRRGFHSPVVETDGTLKLAQLAAARIEPGRIAIQAHLEYASGGGYERRRLSFYLELRPRSFEFRHLDEQWNPDENLGVQDGEDQTTSVSGALTELHDLGFRENRFYLKVLPAVIARISTEREPCGRYYLESVQRGSRARQIDRSSPEHPIFNVRGLEIKFEPAQPGQPSLLVPVFRNTVPR